MTNNFDACIFYLSLKIIHERYRYYKFNGEIGSVNEIQNLHAAYTGAVIKLFLKMNFQLEALKM